MNVQYYIPLLVALLCVTLAASQGPLKKGTAEEVIGTLKSIVSLDASLESVNRTIVSNWGRMEAYMDTMSKAEARRMVILANEYIKSVTDSNEITPEVAELMRTTIAKLSAQRLAKPDANNAASKGPLKKGTAEEVIGTLKSIVTLGASLENVNKTIVSNWGRMEAYMDTMSKAEARRMVTLANEYIKSVTDSNEITPEVAKLMRTTIAKLSAQRLAKPDATDGTASVKSSLAFVVALVILTCSYLH